jgi:ABC-type transporter Mla MlaB component
VALAQAGALIIDAARPDVYVVRVSGTFDRSTANRLVRLVGARVRLAALGYANTRHILVDLAHVAEAQTGALDLLRNARRSAGKAGVTLHLTGCGAAIAALGLSERQALVELPAYPDVAVALREFAGVDDPSCHR